MCAINPLQLFQYRAIFHEQLHTIDPHVEMSTTETFNLSNPATQVLVTWSFEPTSEAEGKSIWDSEGRKHMRDVYQSSIVPLWKHHCGQRTVTQEDFNQMLGSTDKRWAPARNLMTPALKEQMFLFSRPAYGSSNVNPQGQFEVVLIMEVKVGCPMKLKADGKPDRESASPPKPLSNDVQAKFVIPISAFEEKAEGAGKGSLSDRGEASTNEAFSGKSGSLATMSDGKSGQLASDMHVNSLAQSGFQGTGADINIQPPSGASGADTANTGASAR